MNRTHQTMFHKEAGVMTGDTPKAPIGEIRSGVGRRPKAKKP